MTIGSRPLQQLLFRGEFPRWDPDEAFEAVKAGEPGEGCVGTHRELRPWLETERAFRSPSFR